MTDGRRGPVAVRAVNCPSCGAVVGIRTFGHAVNVVCQSCGSLLDAQHEGVTILQQYQEALKFEPLIPLGTRGRIGEVEYEVVGFQVRQITVDGTEYRWREYLLFNPYHPFRYLTEYAGHWNLVSTLRSLPDGELIPANDGTRSYDGRDFKHFQTSTATTIFVLGEFPWQVRVGDTAIVVDYVGPPRMLSAEVNADKEVTWSVGEYTSGAEIWKALSLPGSPPPAEGVFANQPSPYAESTRAIWRYARYLIAAAVVLWLAHLALARGARVFSEDYAYDPRVIENAALVTPVFALDGRPSAVRVDTDTNLENQWMSVGYALVNDDTGQTFEFARDVSYYHGVEDGEAWSEGSRSDSVTVPEVPAGRYFLRIEPEAERTGNPVRYHVTVVRDVATSLWFLVALVLLIIPPVRATINAGAFEQRRWAESDHGSGSSSSDDDDDDGDGDSDDD
jgi:hypothetical protein